MQELRENGNSVVFPPPSGSGIADWSAQVLADAPARGFPGLRLPNYPYNNLIGCIYELALGRASWDNLLDILAAAFPECLVLVSGDDLAARKNFVFAHRGLTPMAATSYVTTYAGLNPWLEAQGNWSPCHVYHDDNLADRAQALGSKYYTNWLGKQGAYDAGTGIVIMRRGARQLTLELRYPAQNQRQIRERAATILGDAAYHFRHAFETSGQAPFAGAKTYLGQVVEALPFAVFFVGADMRVSYSNHCAEVLRRDANAPFVSDRSVLRAIDEATDARLAQLVTKTLATSRASTSILQILSPTSQARYFAIARPASVGGDQNYQLHDAVNNHGPLAMLVVHSQFSMSSLPTELLWRAFGLTETEAQLAEAMLTGVTVAEYAQARLVSKQTLRNQLVGLMRKTGTHRQSELIGLLTRLALTCS